MAQLVMNLTGVDEETANKALLRYETVEDAVDALLEKPATQGDKYIPAKPVMTPILTPEQAELCERGRKLQDKVNAVFSVAHSKTRSPPPLELVPEVSEPPSQMSLEMPQQAEKTESQQGSV
jgi:hypothetical protein